MKNFHLLGKELFQPLILLDVIVDEFDGQCPTYLYSPFSFLTSVEPGFRPPAYARPVRIDSHLPLDVEAPHVDVKVGKRVYDSGGGDGFVIAFFLLDSSMADRNILCRRAR